MNPRVCIITPGQIGSNPRVEKEAAELHKAGYDVTVIATRLNGKLELPDFSHIPWKLKLIDLRTKRYWKRLRAQQVLSRQLGKLVPNYRLIEYGQSAYVQPLLKAALGTPANLYIAHYPPALPAATAAAGRHKAKFSYDAEDFHLGDWPDIPAFDVERRLVRAIEGRYLPKAAYVTAAAPMIAEALAEQYGISLPTVILNVFPKCQGPEAPSPSGASAPGPSLYWFSQTIGPNRGLECAVKAIGLAKSRPHLFLRGKPAHGFVGALMGLAQEHGVSDRLHILPPAAPEQMERIASSFDLGLASETSISRNRNICLTNKLFTFMLAGLPALMSNTPAQMRFATESGLQDLVYPIDNASALAQLIDRFLSNPNLHADMRARCWRLGQKRYNWDQEASILTEMVAKSVRKAPQPLKTACALP